MRVSPVSPPRRRASAAASARRVQTARAPDRSALVVRSSTRQVALHRDRRRRRTHARTELVRADAVAPCADTRLRSVRLHWGARIGLVLGEVEAQRLERVALPEELPYSLRVMTGARE